MPTGITASIYKDEPTTMRQFILRCARQWGVMTRFKEEGVDWKIPLQIEPDLSYHSEQLAEARRELSTLESLSERGIEAAAQMHYEKDRDEAKAYNAKRNGLRVRYKDMQEQVIAWEHTEELEGLKRFALNQLTDSIRFDCGGSGMEVEEMSPQQWHDKQLAALHRDIKCSTEGIEKEKGLVVEINKWLKALHESLGE